jgi:phage terminase small subunit
MSDYIGRIEAMKLLEIKTRQSLHNYTKRYNIATKSQGRGKPTLYLKSDIVKVAKESKPLKEKHNKRHLDKAKQYFEEIDQKKQQHKTDQRNDNLMFDVLDEVGAEHFALIKKLLIENGTYNEVDQGLLISYCISYQGFLKYANIDFIQIDHNGNKKTSPEFKIFNTFVDQMIKTGSILGIGARSRIGLKIKEPKKKNIFDLISEKESF